MPRHSVSLGFLLLLIVVANSELLNAQGEFHPGADFERGSGAKDLGTGYASFARSDFIRERGKLTASDSANLDKFGIVSTDGNTAIVGASRGLVAGSSSGAAYIFVRQHGGRWVEVARLTASDASVDDGFGAAVAISGDVAIVGAAAKERNAGAAYVFSRHHDGQNAWGEVTKLSPLNVLDPLDNFGGSVSISGDTVMVSAFGDDDRGADSGAVYVFRHHHGGRNAWGQTTKFSASDAIERSFFGGVLAQNGDIAAVTARSADVIGTGAVYVFARDHGGPDAWGEIAKLTASDAFTGDAFGGSLGISGETIAVGAPGAEGNRGVPGKPLLGNSGAVYIFARGEGGPNVWAEVAKLTPLDARASDEFGSSVSLRGEIAVIGAAESDETDGFAPRSGSAYVYGRQHGSPDAWRQVVKVRASEPQAGDQFGNSVAIARSEVLIGATGIHALPGAVYVCNLENLSATVGACRRSVPIVNDIVTTTGLTTSSATRRVVTLIGTFTNTGDVPVGGLFFEVARISEGST